jgi:hypothetical protein
MTDRIVYLDFDLRIERSAKGFRTRVLNSPSGQATAQFVPPLSDLELENFVLRVGRTRRGVRRIDSPEMEAAKTFGGRLFEAVFDDEVQSCLRSSLDKASLQGAGLRIRLHLSQVPELADLPWEYLYNPDLNRFFCLSVDTPLVRFLDLAERIRPLKVKPPLRVLVMISSPADHPPLDVEREWANLSQALHDPQHRGQVRVDRLEEATLAALLPRLRREKYHIFHFIGHGGFDRETQDGRLIMEDEHEKGRAVSGQYLGALLHDERTLRLAILNACEGARSSRSDPFAGVAQSLVQQGVPAVIAMQFEITDEAAVTLAHEFYSALADGYPVDGALAEARKAIFARGNDVEWGTPVLYMRAPDGHIFDVEPVSDQDRRRAQAAALFHEAQAAMVQKNWRVAVEKLEAVLDLNPAHAEAVAALSHARQRRDSVVAALSKWFQALPHPWLRTALPLAIVLLLLLGSGIALKAFGIIPSATPTKIAQERTPSPSALTPTFTPSPAPATATPTPTSISPTPSPTPTELPGAGLLPEPAKMAEALISLTPGSLTNLPMPIPGKGSSLGASMGFAVADTAYFVAGELDSSIAVGSPVNYTFVTDATDQVHSATVEAWAPDLMLLLIKPSSVIVMSHGMPLAATRDLQLGEAVHLYSQRQGPVEGRVEGVSVSVKVNHPERGTIALTDVFQTNSIPAGGDIGTPVLDVKGRAVGVVVAGSGQTSIVAPIEQLCKAFRQYLADVCQ